MVSLRLFWDPKTLSGLGLSLKGVGFRAPNIQTDKPVYPGSCGEWITLRCSQDEVWMCVEGLRVCCFSQLGTLYPSGIPILRCSVGAWQVPSVPSSSCSWTACTCKMCRYESGRLHILLISSSGFGLQNRTRQPSIDLGAPQKAQRALAILFPKLNPLFNSFSVFFSI